MNASSSTTTEFFTAVAATSFSLEAADTSKEATSTGTKSGEGCSSGRGRRPGFDALAFVKHVGQADRPGCAVVCLANIDLTRAKFILFLLPTEYDFCRFA